ncbi:MAG: ABC transporter ATP-binding protein [Clostridiales bacterium]|nr:ABC transporter ATP-binding protein [Clostridiales bacterium]
MSYLEVKKINKKFGNKQVLNNVSLEIKKGKVVTLIGPSGVGKTTLLNIIMGLSYQNDGEVIFDGKKLSIPYDKDTRRNIAYIPDNPIFYDYLTGSENIKYIMDIYNSKKSDEEIDEYLKKFNLYDSKDILFRNYSKGMKQKLMLLSTYIIDASLLILDEPTTGLDVLSSYELQQIILEFKKKNKTILLATHDINFCQNVSDYFAIMKAGEIIYRCENNKENNLEEIVIEYLQD